MDRRAYWTEADRKRERTEAASREYRRSGRASLAPRYVVRRAASNAAYGSFTRERELTLSDGSTRTVPITDAEHDRLQRAWAEVRRSDEARRRGWVDAAGRNFSPPVDWESA